MEGHSPLEWTRSQKAPGAFARDTRHVTAGSFALSPAGLSWGRTLSYLAPTSLLPRSYLAPTSLLPRSYLAPTSLVFRPAFGPKTTRARLAGCTFLIASVRRIATQSACRAAKRVAFPVRWRGTFGALQCSVRVCPASVAPPALSRPRNPPMSVSTQGAFPDNASSQGALRDSQGAHGHLGASTSSPPAGCRGVGRRWFAAAPAAGRRCSASNSSSVARPSTASPASSSRSKRGAMSWPRTWRRSDSILPKLVAQKSLNRGATYRSTRYQSRGGRRLRPGWPLHSARECHRRRRRQARSPRHARGAFRGGSQQGDPPVRAAPTLSVVEGQGGHRRDHRRARR